MPDCHHGVHEDQLYIGPLPECYLRVKAWGKHWGRQNVAELQFSITWVVFYMHKQLKLYWV